MEKNIQLVMQIKFHHAIIHFIDKEIVDIFIFLHRQSLEYSKNPFLVRFSLRIDAKLILQFTTGCNKESHFIIPFTEKI